MAARTHASIPLSSRQVLTPRACTKWEWSSNTDPSFITRGGSNPSSGTTTMPAHPCRKSESTSYNSGLHP
eukprot:992882-Alexandrium_andersonii.AAC.1